MAITLVDSNVIIDVLSDDPKWSEWSSQALEDAADDGTIAINPIIYSEVSIRFTRIEDLDEALIDFAFLDVPRPACFLAGKCFQSYRRLGGAKVSTLPDFFIGAHAMVSGLTLLTRDAARYRTYFPKLNVTAPS